MTDPAGLAMVMPMAGRGSRFGREGVALPKPLIPLGDRPFFWWATESLRRVAPLREMVFVVLDEHVRDFAIDRRVHEHYPDARVVGLPEVTSGAAETAAIGLRALSSANPVAINDSDHAFRCPGIAGLVEELRSEADAALMCFRSDSPSYSYAQLGEEGDVIGTVEKRVVSPFAIAGCYFFSDPAAYLRLYDGYLEDCPYDELFVSGIYNRLVATRGRIRKVVTERHLSFGTPEELARLDVSTLRTEPEWLAQP